MRYIKTNRCYVCGGKIVSEEDLTICENCNNIYHKMCWQQIGEECICCNKKVNKKKIKKFPNNPKNIRL